nr:MAG TPA: hypothetical protein [Caudoviricetes sp.]
MISYFIRFVPRTWLPPVNSMSPWDFIIFNAQPMEAGMKWRNPLVFTTMSFF